jgi:hypothetical protein
MPSEADRLLAHAPEIIELSDGEGAVRFIVRDTKGIISLIQALKKIKPKSQNDKLRTIGGFVAGVPQQEHRGAMQTLGLGDAVRMGEAIMW